MPWLPVSSRYAENVTVVTFPENHAVRVPAIRKKWPSVVPPWEKAPISVSIEVNPGQEAPPVAWAWFASSLEMSTS